MTQNYAEAREHFRAAVQSSFDDAEYAYNTAAPNNPTPEQKATWSAAHDAAFAKMGATLGQLAQMEGLGAEVERQRGAKAIADLMEKTRDTVASVCDAITTVVTNNTFAVMTSSQMEEFNAHLGALAGVLTSLAQVSPIAVWRTDGATG